MPANASVNRFALDTDPNVLLRAKGLAAVTADTASGTMLLDVLTSYWDSGELAQNLEFVIVVEFETLALGGGTLNAIVQVDDNASFSSPTAVETRAIAATGRYVFSVTREELNRADIAATHLRVLTDVTGGTTPSWSFNVYAAPTVGD